MKNQIALASGIIVTVLKLAQFSYAETLPHDVLHLQSQRKLALEEIDSKYRIELEKLKIKYTKTGDLEAANAIVHVLNNLKSPSTNKHPVIGKWEFDSKGNTRTFEFKDDSNFTGQLLKNGKKFFGKWSVDGNTIVLWDAERKEEIPHHLKIVSDDELIFVGPAGTMSGRKK
ncbi:MAG: hypothetical protein ACSHX7_10250 [Luteolibacter sp.]